MPALRLLNFFAALACTAGLAMSLPACAQDWSGRLYEGKAPGGEGWEQPFTVRKRGNEEARYNVVDPKVEVYLPDPAKRTGAAVVMLPGGGLRVLGIDDDTRTTIARFLDEGIAVILSEYRTRQLSAKEIETAEVPRPAGAPPMRFPKLDIRNANANPAPDDAELGEVLRLAVMDGQQALRLTRARAAEWNIDPDRVGMIGTSAGGGVAFGAMMANAAGATPDFIISIFGPALQDVTVPADAPPLFLVTETPHGPVTDGLLALAQMWKDSEKPVELHMYDVPNFSMRVTLWGDRLFDWMRERGILVSERAE